MKALLLAGVLALASMGSAQAGSITVGTEQSGNCYPFSCFAKDRGAGAEYQQVYSASSFSGISTITSLSLYRYQGGQMDSATYSLYLSTTQKAVNGLSTDAAANRGADAMLFGTYTLGGYMPDVLTFSGNAFTYDASAGNLLLDIVVDSVTNTVGYQSFFKSDESGTVTSRLFTINGGGYGYDGRGLVTTFGTADAAVPEPGVLALMGLGLAGLAVARRRKTR